MRNVFKGMWLGCALSVLAAAAETPEAGKPQLVVGVFLPASVGDGEKRFQVAQQLATDLQTSLGVAVEGRSFGRFEDFSAALGSGAIAVGLVDGWVAGQLPPFVHSLGVVQAPADKQRLMLVSKETKTVPALKGTRLAVIRGAAGQEAKLLSNLFFQGDLEAHKHFKLVPVPNAESALEAVQAGAADSAVLPAASSSGLQALYTGPALPAVLLVRGKKPVRQAVEAALLKASAALGRVSPVRGDALADLRTLAQRGPPARNAVLAQTPVERFDLGLLDVAALEPLLPGFTAGVRVSEETPDD